MPVTPATTQTRQRVPAAERRDALIEAAMHEFAHGGLHGTPVDRIARRVGVAQPYVFSLFASKRDLFLAAVERCFSRTGDLFERARDEFEEGRAPGECETVLDAMGKAYRQSLTDNRDGLLLQHHAYAACADDVVRERVRWLYARLVGRVRRLSGAGPEDVDEFFRHGMALNVAAALGVEDLSVGCEWVQGELEHPAPLMFPAP